MLGKPVCTDYNAISLRRLVHEERRPLVRELVRYLLEHAVIDFQGDITLEQVRQFLREDDSRDARALLSKLIEDRGVDEFLITIADCLKDHIKTGVTDDVVREQISIYTES